MNVKEDLTKAREIIAVPEHWTQNHLARDKRNCPVPPEDPDAVRFCAIGAIMRALNTGDTLHSWPYDHVRALEETLDQNASNIPSFGVALFDRTGLGVAHFNNTHTHEEVLSLFDQTIARL